MEVTITLPKEVAVEDYHELDSIKRHLKMLIPRVNVTEVGFDGKYIGMAYIGKLIDEENQSLFEKIRKRTGE
jgi:hypothetical protein